MEEYTFGQRTEEAKSLCMLLNEIYQLAVLGMNKDGYTVPPDQMNRVFSTFDDFDQFVANLTAEPTFE